MSDLVDFAVDFGPLIIWLVAVIGCTAVLTWIASQRHAKAAQRAADEAEWAKERVARFHSER